MKILVTGGLGFIGSHTVIELNKKGHEPVILDNLSNSKEEVLSRLEKITSKKFTFYKADINDKKALADIFKKEKFNAVIHFAGLKAVGESVKIPLKYYYNNISGTVILLEVMKEFNVKNIIFSSSATVYGDPESVPVNESAKTSAVNPYGKTKLFIEEILKDLYKSDNKFNIVILRYFNPLGAHESGLIGEDPEGIPNNLLPYVAKVATGELPELKIYGNDYPTKDGTGVRDYIHVTDLADGHVLSLKQIEKNCGLLVVNLGTGRGYSVLEVVKAYEKASGKKVPYSVVKRREGDVAEVYADVTLSQKVLGFKAAKGLDEMCADSWRFVSKK